LTTLGALRDSKARFALMILRYLMSGLNQSQVADQMNLRHRQNISYWVDKFERLGWIICTSPENSTSSGKYYRLSEACLKFLSASDDEFFRAALESQNRVDNLRFEAALLGGNAEGWELLKSKLTQKDGMRNWNRWVSGRGEFDGWTIEMHEGRERKLLVLAGKRYGGRSAEEIRSRVQTDCEAYVRLLGEQFALKFTPVSWVEGTGEYVMGSSDAVFKVLAARNSKLENDAAKVDHSHPHRRVGEAEAKDAAVFNAYTHLPQILEKDIIVREKQLLEQQKLEGKVSSLAERLDKLDVNLPARVQDSVGQVVDVVGTKLGEKIADALARRLQLLGIGAESAQPAQSNAVADGRRYT
jgi:hypothetical protein